MAADPLLTTLVRLVNGGGPGMVISVTLTVKGLVITGDLISAQEYFQQFDAAFREALPEGLRNINMGFGMQLDAEAGDLPEHVHMKDVQAVDGDGRFLDLGWWRGRLENVDGMVLGRLSLD